MNAPMASPDPLTSVAARFKRQRQIERFTQAEIAAEAGVTRSLIAHFEGGFSRLSFAAGYAFCRRADINPRWLATGEEPQRPFVQPDELGVDEAEIEAQAVRGVDYLEGYSAVLASPLEQWAASITVDDLISRQLTGGPSASARHYANKDLQAEIERWAKELGKGSLPIRSGALITLYALLDEMGERLKKDDKSLGKFLCSRRSAQPTKR